MWLEWVHERESIYSEVKRVMARCVYLCVCVCVFVVCVLGGRHVGFCQKLGFYSVQDKHPLGDSEQGNNNTKQVSSVSFWLLSQEQTERSTNADGKAAAKIHRKADDSLHQGSSKVDDAKRLDSWTSFEDRINRNGTGYGTWEKQSNQRWVQVWGLSN